MNWGTHKKRMSRGGATLFSHPLVVLGLSRLRAPRIILTQSLLAKWGETPRRVFRSVGTLRPFAPVGGEQPGSEKDLKCVCFPVREAFQEDDC